MPIYEYVCPTCHEQLSHLRSMSDADAPAMCSSGHAAKRALSMFASSTVGGGTAGSTMTAPSPGPSAGGGCCGGHCH